MAPVWTWPKSKPSSQNTQVTAGHNRICLDSEFACAEGSDVIGMDKCFEMHDVVGVDGTDLETLVFYFQVSLFLSTQDCYSD